MEMVSSRTSSSSITGLNDGSENPSPLGSNDNDELMLSDSDSENDNGSDSQVASCDSDFRELELKIPGPFVVLQGNAGDGLSNTIDGVLPVLTPARRTRRTTTATTTAAAIATAIATVLPQPPTPGDDFHHVSTNAAAGIVNGPRFAVTAGAVAAAVAAETIEQNNANNTIAPDSNMTTDGTQSGSASASSEEFVVVNENSAGPQADGEDDNDNDNDNETSEDDRAAIAEWEASRRRSELQQQRDWEDSLYQVPREIVGSHVMMTRPPVNQATNDPEGSRWWQRNGEVAVFRKPPTKLFDGSIAVNRIGTLPPGSTVWALDLIELWSATMLPIQRNGTATAASSSSPPPPPPSSNTGASRSIAPPRLGVIQLIQFKNKGRKGYVCLSLDGYTLLGPGLPHVYLDPSVSSTNTNGRRSEITSSWIWRVTCPSGAFVRDGLDLATRHTCTLPYGSLVRVGRRCINHQGLSRLRTSGRVADAAPDATPNDSGNRHRRKPVEGWCSELLNPLSGQRGIVAQPLPFPVPAVYRVTLPLGAMIRTDVELSSPQVGVVPFGSLVKVVQRAFSEHPVDKCIERLRLAGNGGWISVRLNLPSPQDTLVVELVDIDHEFNPANPGLYHLNALRSVRDGREREHAERNQWLSSPSDLSSVDESELAHDTEQHTADERRDKDGVNTKGDFGTNQSAGTLKCVVCLIAERNATIVHGETGHVVCCLECARLLKARGDKCPVCRLNIDLVIQHFCG